MIRRQSDMEREVRQRMREGTGQVEILHIFRKDELSGRARLFARLRLQKGCSVGYHPHENEEEIFYILSGTGLVVEDGASTQVKQGDAVLTGGGGSHSIENKGDEPLELLAAILPY